MTKPILLTETEAAAALRLSTRTLRKARADGQLRYILIGRAVRYTMADLESFVETLRQVQPPCPTPAPRPIGTAAAARRAQGAVIVPFHQRRGKAKARERL